MEQPLPRNLHANRPAQGSQSTPASSAAPSAPVFPGSLGWHDTAVAYPRHQTLADLLSAQAARTPDAVALTFEGQHLSYRELDARSNQLARFLQNAGVKPDTLVGLSVFRSFEMVIGLFGILKAGGAYVPIDPEYPRDRTAFMLEDTGASLLLTQERIAGSLPPHAGRTLCLDSQWSDVARESADAVTSGATPDNLAYMIYTSGSTGKPKGALNGHAGVVNRLLWMQERYQLAPGDNVLQKTPFSFDVSVWEFFWPLLVGARLVIAKPGGHQDPAYLAELIRRESIHVLHFVPSMLRAFLDEATVASCRSLRHVICSGEALTYDLQQRFFAVLGCELHNLYGPTEAAVDVTHWTCQRESRSEIVPIGRPVANTRIYILDDKLAELPVGESGELHIGGIQVGKGYHNRPELSAEKFIKDPFSSDPKARLYKTGDLARWMPDGTVDYQGRLDFQVKLRGFRIELGEIESILAQHAAVHQAVVVAKRKPGSDDRLVGYLTARGAQRPSVTELRTHLLSRVPEYMVPAQFVWLDAIPLSPNGKADRKALPEPSAQRPELARPYAAPRTPVEEALAKLWAELLGLDAVGIDDSFFELGGTSLLAVRFTAQWRKAGHADLPIVKVFQFPTIAGLAAWLDAKASGQTAKKPAARARSRSSATAGQDAVAIIGMAARLPGANDVETFWKNLCDGVESITTFPREELGIGIDETLRHDPDYVPARGIIEGAEFFDAAFFGIGALEASVMDPQQRVFLELAYTALEKAGYDPDRTPGPVGVFAGVGDNHYHTVNLLGHPKLLARVGKLALEYGNEKDYIALRAAYVLGLTGPAVSANTGCSTSLLAVDHAVRALSLGECDMALAGGVDVFVPQKSGFLYQEGGTFAKDGHCRPFDADATGTMFCDGAGLVVLKRLDDALADGDTIHAVIRATAKNNNGARTASFLAPSVEGQAEVIAMAQANANIPVETIGYVEAHGTGTPVGDPIEVEALNQVFNAATAKRHFCYLGSHKGNVGHPTIAAGITGLLKAALVLEHGVIPATLHFKTLNPKIDLTDSCFKIAAEKVPYPRTDTPRRAAVSSFGFGGTNVHVILEEPPLPKPGGTARSRQLLLLSAKTPAALASQSALLSSRLDADPGLSLADAAFTLTQGRKLLPHRRFVVAADAAEAAALLRDPNPLKAGARHCQKRSSKLVFLFGGQGTQYVNMGRELYQEEPLFRAVVDECFALLRPHMDRDLKTVLYPAPGDEAAARESIQNTYITQPAIFVIEYALARWWQSLGLEPASMAGHSIGEFVAATLAGVFELPDVLKIVAARGRLMQSMPHGSMLSVKAPAAEVEALLPPDLQLAALNGPNLCVVAGPTASVEAFRASLDGQGKVARLLHTSHAFHSAMMEPMLEPLRAEFNGVRLSPPKLPFVSTVTGQPITAELACDPLYWTRHARVSVRFSDAVQTLLAQRYDLFLECGPRSTLSTLTRQHATADKPVIAIPSLGEAAETIGEVATLLQAAGTLWLNGVDIDWDAFYAQQDRRRIALPTYPFDRQRHWVDPVPTSGAPVPLPSTAQSPTGPQGAEASPHAGAPSHRVQLQTSTEGAEATRHAVAPVQQVSTTQQPSEPQWSEAARHAVVPVQQVSTAQQPSEPQGAEAGLLEIIAPISGRKASDIDHQATFLEQGFDSLLLVQITTALRNELGAKLGFNQLMTQFPNVKTLAAHLSEALGKKVVAAQPAPKPVAAAPLPAAATSADSSVYALLDAQGKAIAHLTALVESLQQRLGGSGSRAPFEVSSSSTPPMPVWLPTSASQKGIYLSSQLSEKLSASYNESMAIRVKGMVVPARLEKAIRRLSERHDALRASLAPGGKSLTFTPRASAQVVFQDLTAAPDKEKTTALDRLLALECEKSFDLGFGTLFRALVVRLNDDEAVVVLTGHHLICDGWSHDVLVHDFCAFYSAELTGKPYNFAPVKSFGAYLSMVATRETSEDFTSARAYWEKKFADGFPLLDLPTDRPRSRQRNFEARCEKLGIPAPIVQSVRSFAAKQGASFFSALLTTYSLFLAHASGQRRFVIALPTAEQPIFGEPFLVGNCVNMIPFLVDLPPNASVAEVLASVQAQLSEAHQHSVYSSLHLLNRLRPKSPNPKSRPLSVGTTFLQKWKPGELPQQGFTIDFEVNPKRFESFECYLAISDGGADLGLSCNYETAVFDAHTIKQWLSQFAAIFTALPASASAPWTSVLPAASTAKSVREAELFELASEITDDATGLIVEDEPIPALIINDNSESSQSALAERVLTLWRKTLALPEAGPDSHFFEAGGNSLAAAKFTAELERTLAVKLPMSFFYSEEPTPAAVTKWLVKQHPQLITAPLPAITPEYEGPSWLPRHLRRMFASRK